MKNTHPASVNKLETHNTSQGAHPNGFDHNIDMHHNSIKYVTFIDCTDHMTVDASKHKTDKSTKPFILLKSGSAIGSSGQQGALIFKDTDSVQISIIEAASSTTTTLLRVKVSSPTETGTGAGTGFTLCEFMVAEYPPTSGNTVPFINAQYRYIANAHLHSYEINHDEALVNKKYVDKHLLTKEEYCSDLSNGVLLTDPACAWDPTDLLSITLSQPYTNFRFLRVDYTGKDVNVIGSNIIDVSLFHKLMTTTHIDRGVGTDVTYIAPHACAVYNLCGDSVDPSWMIWTSNSCVGETGGAYASATKSTTTKFTHSSNTGLILGIWGFK